MQKLSGKSMVVLCKSCRIFHNKSKQIGFVFFWFFYDFLRSLQDSAKPFYYWSFHFTPGSLDVSTDSQPCPPFTQNTLERKRKMQCGPWAWRAARLTGIGQLRRLPWRGKRWGRTRGSPVADLWPKTAGGTPAVGLAVTRREHSRSEVCFGEHPNWEENKAARAALAGSRAAARSVGLRRCWPEGAAPQRCALAGPTACVRGERPIAAFIAGWLFVFASK
jgi:hypothetical protein